MKTREEKLSTDLAEKRNLQKQKSTNSAPCLHKASANVQRLPCHSGDIDPPWMHVCMYVP